MAGEEEETASIRVLCPKLVLSSSKQDSSSLQWLIGSPFLPPFTIASTIRCIHFKQRPDHPAISEEAEDLRSVIVKGFRVIGALISGRDGDLGGIASEAIDSAVKLTRCLTGLGTEVENLGFSNLVGGVFDSSSGEVRFFVSKLGKAKDLVAVNSVLFEEEPAKYVWERGCLLRCELPIQLPVYVPADNSSDAERKYLHAHEAVIAKLKDPLLTFILGPSQNVAEGQHPIIIRGADLDFVTDLSNVKHSVNSAQITEAKLLSCSHFCLTNKNISSPSAENADTIQVTPMLTSSGSPSNLDAPIARFCPASGTAKLWILDYKLDVVCYASIDLPLKDAVSKLIIPALVDQLTTMKHSTLPFFLKQHPQLRPYHFKPPGILHPITVVCELTYGEMESKQVEMRRSLHLRLGLPCDRPLLRAANALTFADSSSSKGLVKRGTTLLKDVHAGIPSSGVAGGLASLVQGSYEYYHYLQDSFDDSGWGCAYRSLQTIISWFKLQHYTAIDVPTHREVQQALVEIGDKDPSFVGSREWIGAIELSYVLDKLLGVTCKVINVRSGSELPEKCRELSMHFENQGTPVMIGGGVLAYTLLGVDYNEVSGDCAFLILDPHYTGGEDLKKIVNGGWCGWKKAIDSKGKKFFLDDKFYNLLLPQRPDMV